MDLLKSKTAAERLRGLETLAAENPEIIESAPAGEYRDTNCHIHTDYSFSPYTPTEAVWYAKRAGLLTAGIMDHDSVGGAAEFTRAGEIAGLLTTAGIECRVKTDGTRIAGRQINNTDQKGIAYISLYGIPAGKINRTAEFFAPYTAERIKRSRAMTGRLNNLLSGTGIALDFDRDIVGISRCAEGGSITERHILFALSRKIIESRGRGSGSIDFLTNHLKTAVPVKIAAYLSDETNPHYEYDLLGVLKSGLIERFYIDADAECPHVSEVIALSEEIGSISAYAYLGDVTDSVTGDKKAQEFEDSYLDLLFRELSALGFRAVTYMPSRNTAAQLARVRELCREYGFFEISGEDINSPRQPFICVAQRGGEFAGLADSALALIAHERRSEYGKGMFSQEMISQFPKLEDRVKYFKNIISNT